MQPIIQRTLTISETWTIIWPDGHETTWHTTEAVVLPGEQAPNDRVLPLIDADDDQLDDDAGEQTKADR